MAKGVEDTAFYVYNRFISSNEVGGSAKSFGIDLDLWHDSNRERLEHSPDSMLTTSTHDTKRSEDVRNRLNVLSEMPSVWAKAVRRWQRANANFKRRLEDGRLAPDANEEYLLYQTIVGAWPWVFAGEGARREFLERIQQYSTKALSEAKVNLSWLNPNPEYVDAVHGFLASILMPDQRGRDSVFVRTLNDLLPQLKLFGGVNSLAQVLLKITSPGVPDIYQGTELWDLSLVDPDNRRPVDYKLRQEMLTRIEQEARDAGALAVVQRITADQTDGSVKLWTTSRALELRRAHHALFRRGSYIPLLAQNAEQHGIAFGRLEQRGDEKAGAAAITFAPRFSYTLMHGRAELPLGAAWKNASLELPEELRGGYRNVFTDEEIDASSGSIQIAQLLAKFPVGLLIRK
jgi:(1->4)-alpha-D-glucan 1-alpha-D-glucosylmutase